MKKYVCPCGYEYDPAIGDPDNGIAPGTAWEDVPADWACPVCGLGKDSFTENPRPKTLPRELLRAQTVIYIPLPWRRPSNYRAW